MRMLSKVQEFQAEAGKAVFTKQQAVAVTMRLLDMEARAPENTPEETEILLNALKKAEFRYLDMTKTETDALLDSLNVARFSVEEIVNAVNAIVFDAQ